MAITTPAGTTLPNINDLYPYTVRVEHGLKRFYSSYPWAKKNLAEHSWRMTVNETHYVFYFKQQEDCVRFTLTCL